MAETLIRPLTREYVREILTGLGLKVLADSDGDALVLLGDEKARGVVFMVFAVSARGVLSYVGQVQSVSLDEGEALSRANAWNSGRRWPRAFVRKGKLYLDYHWDLEHGVHPQLLKDLLVSVIAGTHQFLLWLEGKEA